MYSTPMDGTLHAKVSDAPSLRLAGNFVEWLGGTPFVVRIALLFVAVLATVAAFPARPAARRGSDVEVLTTPAPYVACGIAESFDAVAGHCVPAQPVAPPCVLSARGGCMATTAALPTPQPQSAPASQADGVQQPSDPFAGIMGITRDH
jgi:hypothetical protein